MQKSEVCYRIENGSTTTIVHLIKREFAPGQFDVIKLERIGPSSQPSFPPDDTEALVDMHLKMLADDLVAKGGVMCECDELAVSRI